MYDFIVYDVHDNDEFLTFAKLDLVAETDGFAEIVETLEFSGSSEFMDSAAWGTAVQQAASCGHAWIESQTFTLEERLGEYGLEWEREQYERELCV